MYDVFIALFIWSIKSAGRMLQFFTNIHIVERAALCTRIHWNMVSHKSQEFMRVALE